MTLLCWLSCLSLCRETPYVTPSVSRWVTATVCGETHFTARMAWMWVWQRKKNILVRITEENAWMFPTKFWRQTDSNPHQKLWCKSALESEYYWHTYATHTHTCHLMWWQGIISSQQVSWSHSDRRCMIKPSLHELTKTTAEIKSGRGDALLWKGKDKRMDSY